MKRTRTERDNDAAYTCATLEMCFSMCTQQGMEPPLALVVVETVAAKLAAVAGDGFDPTLHAARLLNSSDMPVPLPPLTSRRRARARRAEPLPFRGYVFGFRPRLHIPAWAKLF